MEPLVIGVIVLGYFLLAIYFSFKYKFIQFRAVRETKKILIESKSKSSYSTFMLSMASHMGTGNIVGISTALIYGGAGTIFWMWIFTIFSAIFSLIENTLSQVYKERINCENRGGACFYIEKGLGNNLLALIFALILLCTNTIFFQPLQVNTISETLHLTLKLDKVIILILFVIFTYIVIFNGTRRIVKFSEMIVPIMSISYLLVTSYIIIANISNLPLVFKSIFKEAFNFKAILLGGFSSCLIIGFKRSLFSNEAGLGTMPSISAMAEVKNPIEQGFVSTVGVYVDTLLMCTLTGISILIFDIKNLSNFLGVDLIIHIFEKEFGRFGFYLSGFFMLTFALATVVGEFYLGESNLLYLVKRKKKMNLYRIFYKVLFLVGIYIGVTNNTKEIFNFVDSGMIFLGLANIYAIIKLKKVFDNELHKYYGIK